MPTIVSGVAGQDGNAPTILPQIGDGIGDFTVYQRTSADSLRNEAIVSTLQASNRRTLLISGVSTEVAVQLPALTAADMGYRVLIVIDACGGMSERTEQAAIQRISKSGVATVSVMTLAGELSGDFRTPEAQAAVGILYEMATA
jgi:nicotinamidase-related amidase